MRKSIVVGAVVLVSLLGTMIARSRQSPSIRPVEEASLREYAGTYRWDPNAFVYLQMWSELTGDAISWSRSTKPAKCGRCIRPNATASSQGRVRRFRRDRVSDRVSTRWRRQNHLAHWSREGAPARTARRVDIERREDVRFSNGDVQLAGTLIGPTTRGAASRRDSRSRVGR